MRILDIRRCAFIGIAVLAAGVLWPSAADARCRSIVLRVKGVLTKPLGPNQALDLRTSPAGTAGSRVEVDGRRFDALVGFYPGGASTADEDCSARPDHARLVLVSDEDEQIVARLRFPADFRNTEGTVWDGRKSVRVNPDVKVNRK